MNVDAVAVIGILILAVIVICFLNDDVIQEVLEHLTTKKVKLIEAKIRLAEVEARTIELRKEQQQAEIVLLKAKLNLLADQSYDET
jgi:hypothetical protein